MDSTHVLYCDESGHSGANLLKPDDPILILATLAFPTGRAPALIDRVQRLRDGTQAQDLKFTSLHGTVGGRRVLREFAELLNEEQPHVFLAVVEKRFIAAALVIETFLDPTHNELAPRQDDANVRIDLANVVLSVASDDFLGEFVGHLRQEEREGVRAFGHRLAERLNLHHFDLAHTLAGAIRCGLGNDGEFFFFAERLDEAPRRSEKVNPIVHAFLPLVSSIDAYAEKVGWRVDLVADEDPLFGPVLDNLWSLIKDPVRSEMFAEFGLRPNGLPRWNSYRRADEIAEPGLLLADLAAGMTRHVALRRMKGEEFSPDLQPLWQALHACVLRAEMHSYVAVSDAPWTKGLLNP